MTTKEDKLLREVQKTQLEILIEFDRVCKKHNIKYQLFAGTLLGAVRHEGFIPWDDDIDVCLLRNDYEKIVSILKVEVDEKYFLQDYNTDPQYIMQFAKLRKNSTIFLEKATENCDIHHGVYIDIFPLDCINPETFIGKIQQKLLYIIGRLNLSRIKNICNGVNNQHQRRLSLIVHYLMKLVPKKFTNSIQNKICCMFNRNLDCKYVSHLTNGASKSRLNKYMVNKSEFYNTVEGNFEGYKFPIPVNYDKVLKKLFGDYKKLPPIEERKPHHGIIKIEL